MDSRLLAGRRRIWPSGRAAVSAGPARGSGPRPRACGDGTAARACHAGHPATCTAARPARRAPPPAPEEGLRRATAYDLTPVDAQPLDSSPA